MSSLFNLDSDAIKGIEDAKHTERPVTQVTQLRSSDEDQLKRAWEADAVLVRKQSGCISVQLHQCVGEAGVFSSQIDWRSIESFLKAKETLAQAPGAHITSEPYPRASVGPTHLLQIIPIGGGNICDGSRNFRADHRTASDPTNPEKSIYALDVKAEGGSKGEPAVHSHWIRFGISATKPPQTASSCMDFTLSVEDAHALGVWLAEKSARVVD